MTLFLHSFSQIVLLISKQTGQEFQNEVQWHVLISKIIKESDQKFEKYSFFNYCGLLRKCQIHEKQD